MPSLEAQKALLNRYYFDEFAPQLPAPLRELATNPQVLYHRDVEGAFTDVIQYALDEYWLLPWLLSDLFAVEDATLQGTSRAYLLLFLGYLVQDHLIDQQAPDLPLIPLLAQHLHNRALEQLHAHIGDCDVFWRSYYTSTRAHAAALSMEHESVAQHKTPLDYDGLRRIAAGKAMPFQIATAAMGCLSHNETLIAPVQRIFELYFAADQLYDDVQDYAEDWQERRATMVFAQLAAADGDSLASVFEGDWPHIARRIEVHAIREALTQQSSAWFQQARDALPASAEQTRLGELLARRITWNQQRLQSYRGVRLLQSLRRALE